MVDWFKYALLSNRVASGGLPILVSCFLQSATLEYGKGNPGYKILLDPLRDSFVWEVVEPIQLLSYCVGSQEGLWGWNGPK